MTDAFDVTTYQRVVLFTGAGLSAESGVPTYRGAGGIWSSYPWQEVACEAAFERDPAGVIAFHRLRRQAVAACAPNAAHHAIARFLVERPETVVVTQNTDGLLERTGCRDVIELHGSLWLVRCACGERPHPDADSQQQRCEVCGDWLRPAITWFDDAVDVARFEAAAAAIAGCDLFISVGTSGLVYPAASLIEYALSEACTRVEINPEPTTFSEHFDRRISGRAGEVLPGLFASGAVRTS